MNVETLHLLSSLVGLIAGIAVIYVSMRLAQFETRFLEKIEEKFVTKDVFETEKASIGRDVNRLYKKVFNGSSE